MNSQHLDNIAAKAHAGKLRRYFFQAPDQDCACLVGAADPTSDGYSDAAAKLDLPQWFVDTMITAFDNSPGNDLKDNGLLFVQSMRARTRSWTDISRAVRPALD